MIKHHVHKAVCAPTLCQTSHANKRHVLCQLCLCIHVKPNMKQTTDWLSLAKWSIWQQNSRQKAASDPHQHQPFFNQLPCLSCRNSCHRAAWQFRWKCVLLWANPFTSLSDCALFFLLPLPYLLPCLLPCSGLLKLKYPISLLYPLKLLWRLNRCHSLQVRLKILADHIYDSHCQHQ